MKTVWRDVMNDECQANTKRNGASSDTLEIMSPVTCYLSPAASEEKENIPIFPRHLSPVTKPSPSEEISSSLDSF